MRSDQTPEILRTIWDGGVPWYVVRYPFFGVRVEHLGLGHQHLTEWPILVGSVAKPMVRFVRYANKDERSMDHPEACMPLAVRRAVESILLPTLTR